MPVKCQFSDNKHYVSSTNSQTIFKSQEPNHKQFTRTKSVTLHKNQITNNSQEPNHKQFTRTKSQTILKNQWQKFQTEASVWNLGDFHHSALVWNLEFGSCLKCGIWFLFDIWNLVLLVISLPCFASARNITPASLLLSERLHWRSSTILLLPE